MLSFSSFEYFLDPFKCWLDTTRVKPSKHNCSSTSEMASCNVVSLWYVLWNPYASRTELCQGHSSNVSNNVLCVRFSVCRCYREPLVFCSVGSLFCSGQKLDTCILKHLAGLRYTIAGSIIVLISSPGTGGGFLSAFITMRAFPSTERQL